MNNRIIPTICKHIVAQETLSGACEGIRIDEPTDGRIIISALEVIEPSLGVVVAVFKLRANRMPIPKNLESAHRT